MTLKKIAIFLVCILLFEPVVLAAGLSPLIDSKTLIKFGELEQNEIWEGKVFLIGDVIVPYDKKLIIRAGTQLIFDERDIMEGGKHKDQCELIVYGMVEANASAKEPIQMISVLGFDSQKILELDESVKIIRFTPYEIDTESLKKEFRSFKHNYFVLWTLLTGMWIFARNI